MKKEQAELCLRQKQWNLDMRSVLDNLKLVEECRSDAFEGHLIDFQLGWQGYGNICDYLEAKAFDSLRDFIDKVGKDYQEFIDLTKDIREVAELKEVLEIKKEAKKLFLDLCHWCCENCDKPLDFLKLTDSFK